MTFTEICMTSGCHKYARVPDHLCAACRSEQNADDDDMRDRQEMRFLRAADKRDGRDREAS